MINITSTAMKADEMELDAEDMSLLIIACNNQMDRIQRHIKAMQDHEENYSQDLELVYHDKINRLRKLRYRIAAEKKNLTDVPNKYARG